MEKKFKLGIIGYGFMAKAIIGGILKTDNINPNEIIVSNKNGNFGNLEAGVSSTSDNVYLAKNSEYIMLAVKPQSLNEVIGEIKDVNVSKIISVLAGVKKAKIKESFSSCKVARCMPNTPCAIGLGVTAVDCVDFAENEKSFMYEIFSSCGNVVFITEDKMDAVTGISGSGPAYVYLFIQSLTQAGVNQGLKYDEALSLAVNTVIGSAHMVKNAQEKSLDDLISAVCSKGGTTLEAVKTFRNNGFTDVIEKAVAACVNRAKELGGENKAPTDEIVIYTDGACSGNPGIGGWGAILMHGDNIKKISGGEELTTNNRMELMAVISALKALKKPCKVKLYTDSAYVADAFIKGWVFGWRKNGWQTSSKSEVKNIDLWEELLKETARNEVDFIKVKGHSDNEYNNECDKMAREECKKRQKLV